MDKTPMTLVARVLLYLILVIAAFAFITPVYAVSYTHLTLPTTSRV